MTYPSGSEPQPSQNPGYGVGGQNPGYGVGGPNPFVQPQEGGYHYGAPNAVGYPPSQPAPQHYSAAPAPQPYSPTPAAPPAMMPAGGTGGYHPAPHTPGKSKVAAALLAFFLGGFGAHNFYLGYNGRAIAQLGLFAVGWFTIWILIGVVPLSALGIWVLVDFFMILSGSGGYDKDSRGVPLQ